MELQNSAQIVQSLYLAYIGRAADPDGLAYWQGQLESGEVSTEAIEQAIIGSDEASGYLAELDSGEYVRSLYNQYFERDPGDDEVAYWAGRVDNGELGRANLANSMIDAASEFDREALSAKLAVANYYSQNVAQEDYDAQQALALDNLHSNEALYAALQQLDSDHEAMTLEQVGESVEGNPLYSAVVGTGPQTLMIATQQHGDEPLGTEAALYLLDYLAGDSAEAQALREEVTVVVMPRVNPDGFARWQEQVAGGEDILDPRRNSNDIDLNRTYDPSVPNDPDLAPESAAVRQVVEQYQPDLFVDMHHQNNYRSTDGSLDTLSALWATNEGVDASLMETGQRAIVSIDQALEEFEHANLTLYPGSDNPAIGRNGLGLDGTATLLVEQRGLQEMDQLAQGVELDYSALAGALTLESYLAMKGIAESMASGEFEQIDPSLALEIPERSDSIDFAELYGDDQYVPTEDEPTMVAEEVPTLGIQHDDALIA
ncbi:M14 family zinc carboxypeptidase [Modicisalibacter radicis]|uniref:M14 family zinc carboxypeptidase n=1 Tax=Halomonas sp. EAR18 TaxID=2518972 RepID=UPI00109C3305|nr:M14 family zinc carboxypeptidase [Halomonas sp. EAR18]